MSIISVSDIVESNGKTNKENNLSTQHTIPLRTLVEISYDSEYEDDSENKSGLRLFVVNHSRDCDGTPLYNLSFDLTAYTEWYKLNEKVKSENYLDSMDQALTKAIWWQTGGKILRHYSADSLKVIGKPSKKDYSSNVSID